MSYLEVVELLDVEFGRFDRYFVEESRPVSSSGCRCVRGRLPVGLDRSVASLQGPDSSCQRSPLGPRDSVSLGEALYFSAPAFLLVLVCDFLFPDVLCLVKRRSHTLILELWFPLVL